MSLPSPRRAALAAICLAFLSPELPAARAQDEPAAQDRAAVQDQPAAQEPQAAEVLPEIPEEPRTVDPATLVPEKLAAPATVDLRDSSIREVAQWVQEHTGVPVLFDNRALSDQGIPLAEPISDRLRNEPVYLLLNRLQSLGLVWLVKDDIVHITTAQTADEQMRTQPYTVGDLLDAGYEPNKLIDAILSCTSGPWEDIDGTGGSIELLGDVLFVRHTDSMQREVGGLLTALRRHSAQTFTLDTPQHIQMREALDKGVSVEFEDTPLATAVSELAEMSGIDIRLDMPALRENRVRDREPVSLTLADRNLRTVLHVLLADPGLKWILRDGVLWVTTADRAEEHHKTAVYDVRDLCRDEDESTELQSAILKQTSGPWEDVDGTGGTIAFARPGTMVVHHTEDVLREIRELLRRYREALRASKPRDRDAVDPQEVITRYYRVHERVADSLADSLPQLVLPESWGGEGRAILKVASEPELRDASGRILRTAAEAQSNVEAYVVPRAVLIIRQTRAAHDEIVEVIRRVEHGDPLASSKELEGAGVQGGGGGFGGGFFSVNGARRQDVSSHTEDRR
jgi:hypothetical protein